MEFCGCLGFCVGLFGSSGQGSFVYFFFQWMVEDEANWVLLDKLCFLLLIGEASWSIVGYVNYYRSTLCLL